MGWPIAGRFASRCRDFRFPIGAFTIEFGLAGTFCPNYRVWAQLDEPYRPDGIAMDADGGVWFGNTMTGNWTLASSIASSREVRSPTRHRSAMVHGDSVHVWWS